MDKRCQNCEHYTGPREVKNGFLGVSVNAGYSDHSMCAKTNHKASAGMTCNCSHFEVWSKLQLELEKERAKKEKAREEKENRRQAAVANQPLQPQYEERHSESKHVSDVELKLMEAEMKQTIHKGRVRDFENMKKLRAVPIIFSVLGTLMLVLGIIFKVLANKVAESNANSSSYYAKQNQSNAATTSTLGTVFIVISIICIIVPWLIWFYKYSKAKKAIEEI